MQLPCPRLTKIVATVGPASRDREQLEKLINAGVNIFRLNFSHAMHDILPQVIGDIRDLSQKLETPIAILGDLQGPKFRTGRFPDGQPIQLTPGQRVEMKASTDIGAPDCITTPNSELIEALSVNQMILLADGTLSLRVIEKHSPGHVTCEVVNGGDLGERKGINIPGVRLNIPAMTEKDREDALFVLQHGLDFVALSFVQCHEDVLELRHFLQANENQLKKGHQLPSIVAKIERPTSLDDIDAIIDATDVIMVARGDLGVELSPEKVPVVQKQLIQKANEAEKPVITATQMMETMINEPVPTRAEVSDIVNAVFDGTDAVMLSGETAMGKYPVVCVETMARIVQEAEQNLPADFGPQPDLVHHTGGKYSQGIRCSLAFHQSIAQSAVIAGRSSTVSAVVVYSQSGSMARRISKQKPRCAVIALTPDMNIQRKMTLLWGVHPLVIRECLTTEQLLGEVETTLQEKHLLARNAPIVFCAGETPLVGLSNTLRLYYLGESLHNKAIAAKQENSMSKQAIKQP